MCCHGKPCRQNVLRCVVVAVVMCATLAIPFTVAQGQPLVQGTALRTHLGAREPAVNLHDTLAVHRSLRFESSNCRSDTCITETAGKTVIFGHAAKVQVFDTDGVEPLNETSRKFVLYVLSGIRDPLMQAGELTFTLRSPVTAFCFSGEALLNPLHLPFVRSQVAWVRNPFSVGQCGETTDAEIDADIVASLWKLFGVNLDNHRDEIATRRFTNNGHGRWVTNHVTGPLHFESTQLGDRKSTVARLKLECGSGVLGRLLSIFPTKRRISGAFLEEVDKRNLQLSQRLLRWNRRYLLQPRVVGVSLQGRQGCTRLAVIHSPTTLVGGGALIQPPVVGEPSTSECVGQVLLLLGRWVTPIRVPDFHTYRIASQYVNVKYSVKKGGMDTL